MSASEKKVAVSGVPKSPGKVPVKKPIGLSPSQSSLPSGRDVSAPAAVPGLGSELGLTSVVSPRVNVGDHRGQSQRGAAAKKLSMSRPGTPPFVATSCPTRPRYPRLEVAMTTFGEWEESACQELEYE